MKDVKEWKMEGKRGPGRKLIDMINDLIRKKQYGSTVGLLEAEGREAA